MPTALLRTERPRNLTVDSVRRRALERLYEKRAAVEELILSLERYQEASQKHRANCVEFSADRKCS